MGRRPACLRRGLEPSASEQRVGCSAHSVPVQSGGECTRSSGQPFLPRPFGALLEMSTQMPGGAGRGTDPPEPGDR